MLKLSLTYQCIFINNEKKEKNLFHLVLLFLINKKNEKNRIKKSFNP